MRRCSAQLDRDRGRKEPRSRPSCRLRARDPTSRSARRSRAGEAQNITAGLCEGRRPVFQTFGTMAVAAAGSRWPADGPQKGARLPRASRRRNLPPIRLPNRVLVARFPIAARPIHIGLTVRIPIRLTSVGPRLVRPIDIGLTVRIPIRLISVGPRLVCICAACRERQ
jgi:hypothetical protein